MKDCMFITLQKESLVDLLEGIEKAIIEVEKKYEINLEVDYENYQKNIFSGCNVICFCFLYEWSNKFDR